MVSPEEQRANTRRSLDEATAEQEQRLSPPPGISREEVENASTSSTGSLRARTLSSI